MKKKKPSETKRFVAFVASSIDGRISLTKTHPPNWTSAEDWQFFQKELGKCDAVVVGRNTYEGAIERLKKRNTFVLTTRAAKLKKIGTVTFLNPRRENLKKLLTPYRRIGILGGASAYQFMLDAKMFDELFATIEPLVFGRGKPMFEGGTKTHRLGLLSVKKLNRTGTLLLHYSVIR